MKWFVVEIMDSIFLTSVEYVMVTADSAKEAARIVQDRLSSEYRYVHAVYKETRWK